MFHTMPRPDKSELYQELEEEILNGNKVQAIKMFREMTGLDLKEAKDKVEEIELRLRAEQPEKFTDEKKSGGGCMGTVLLIGGLGVITWLALRISDL